MFVCFSDCQPPIDPSYGSYYFTLTTFQSIATLSCDPGFMTNMTSVTCLDIGNWNAAPSCDRIGISLVTNTWSKILC